MQNSTTKRAVRLARLWMMLKDRPYTISQLTGELGVHWRTIYVDLIDLQLEPLEAHYAPSMVACGVWRVCGIGGEEPAR